MMIISYSKIEKFLILMICFLPRRIVLGGSFKLYTICIISLLLVECYLGNFQILKIRELFSFPVILYMILTIIPYIIHGEVLRGVFALVDNYCIVYAICLYKIRNKYENNLIDSLINVIGIIACLGIIQAISGFNLFDIVFGKLSNEAANGVRFGFVRCYGPFTTSINMGFFMVIGSSLILYRLMETNRPPQIYKFLYIASVLCTILTVSRAAIICLVFSQIFILIWTGWVTEYKKLAKTVIFTTIIACVIIAASIFGLSKRFGFVQDVKMSILAILGEEYVTEEYLDYVGAGDRDELPKWIMEDVGDSQLFGLGGDATFSRYLNRWRTKTSIENTYLNLYFHYGIFGVSGYLVIICSILIYLLKNRNLRWNGDNSYNKYFFMASIAYFAGAYTFGAMDEQRLYCIVLGITIALNRVNTQVT